MASKDRSAPVIVCGHDTLTLGIIEELRRSGEQVVLLTSPGTRLQRDGLSVRIGSFRSEEDLLAAGVATARAVVLAEDDDVGNLHAALAVQDLDPNARIVLRMFNLDLGRRVETLFRDCTALSSSALAAPVFVAAALEGDTPHEHPRRVHRPWPVAPVTFTLFLRRVGPRLKIVGGVLLLLSLLSAVIFHLFADLDPIDAVYFTITIITTTGFGDINLRDAPPALKLYGAALMLFGAATLALLYGIIADTLVHLRLEQALGGHLKPMQGHVVVCGLGNLGYRIVDQLAGLGIPVVAVEIKEDTRFTAATRALGVPVVIGDAKLPQTLGAAHAATARCLLACTNHDSVNIEAAVNGRGLNPDLRVVLRVFDPDFAARLERAFGVPLSKSVSQIAAPAFAAAALERRVMAEPGPT